ncbi:MAG: MBL fold metallo-hydrolase [Anaerolineae bacterium]|nr:MBL fold metallo-hydrolase [Anaerolineae bacterium]
MHPFTQLVIPAGSVGIHWFEQNAYALKNSRGTIVQVDPFYPADRPAERYIHASPPLIESELPTDIVLMTHAHGDHTHSPTIARIHASWPEARYIGPRESIDQILAETEVGSDHTTAIGAGDSVVLDNINVRAFYSKPPAGDPEAGIRPPDVTHLGYAIKMEGIVLYFTGDAINTLASHDELIVPIAALKPDIGFLTTHPTEGEFPFFEGSILLAQKLRLKTAVPSHYACFTRRTYDPYVWASLFPAEGPKPLIIPWNSHVIYP